MSKLTITQFFEDLDAPPKWLKDLARKGGVSHHIRMLEEGVPEVF